MRRPAATPLLLSLCLSLSIAGRAAAEHQATVPATAGTVSSSAEAARDKTPQPVTIGPAAQLSAAQRAAIAAKPITVLPAPAAPQTSAAAKSLDAASSARATPLPSIDPLIRVTLGSSARPTRGPAAPALVQPGRSRPGAPESSWTTSPALGPIPRLSWRIPALVKPEDRIWVGSPSGGEQLPVPAKVATPARAGER